MTLPLFCYSKINNSLTEVYPYFHHFRKGWLRSACATAMLQGLWLKILSNLDKIINSSWQIIQQ